MTKKTEDSGQADAAESADAAPHMSDITGVRYTGSANRKILTVRDFESLNIPGIEKDLVWDSSNNRFVLVGDFNAAARDWFAKQQDFSIE